MNISSSRVDPDPFVPSCLFLTAIYDPTIELLYEDDPEATQKRAVVREEVSE